METPLVNTYTPARQRAVKKYYETHKDVILPKVLERNRLYYTSRKDTEEWKAKKRMYNQQYLQKKKEKSAQL